MFRELELKLSPEENSSEEATLAVAAQMLRIPAEQITALRAIKRSLDARRHPIHYIVKAEVWWDEPAPALSPPQREYPDVSQKPRVIIVGAGPAGLFAALRLIELGLCPIVLERGKDVRARRRDLAAIHKEHKVNPDSNYCFGEGGAGTYSDGKLYTRSKKRGNVLRVLETLVAHGANPDIMVNAHPHIGTNKLPQIITQMREAIINAGGEVRFDARVDDLLITDEKITGVRTADGQEIIAPNLILATGHSARDIFELLHEKNVLIEAKPFAIGLRVEHPQTVIDSAQYKCELRGEHLPPASYNLVQQVGNIGVYSFCMCPGGIVAPCATSQEEIVTNGWSPSKRNNPYANSGVVVTVDPERLPDFKEHGAMTGLRYQKAVERKAWVAGGKTQVAPAQRMTDFISGRVSHTLPESSYQPGIVSANLHDVLPRYIGKALRTGLEAFGRKMRGYHTKEAVLHGVESRTSSPIRIPRDKESLEHVQIAGLYPCGEGAGYAGGIVSAAIDGERCAVKIAEKLGITVND